ncbi:hypothetical protein CSB93_1334 [Pseudomonas paraeruginosa]|uniref:Uncharacterized protein n=1 Tax=Pseudomonas paraeruginosa TaxID=2994495 RepID=A0A2R3IYI9_9PSED|nr:hypothetical protein CSB93_1334 [Pseudomonas paraeruginosa]AWE95318.1 hypothetical protein CSC28_0104 [Pseudomonas paraeruginosa]PTC39136.1 hypothetical protein CLJ1_0079 [Pseudomonas aeruginosa]
MRSARGLKIDQTSEKRTMNFQAHLASRGEYQRGFPLR